MQRLYVCAHLAIYNIPNIQPTVPTFEIVLARMYEQIDTYKGCRECIRAIKTQLDALDLNNEQ